MTTRSRGPTIKTELLRKSREAALNAVQTFNNPLTTFKSETFIVLMTIAWTYLLHAYYREKGIEYRYHTQGPIRRKFEYMDSGAFRYWDLSRCIKDSRSPLDDPTTDNLRFLIGLRNEIVHHQSVGVDYRFSSRYLACCLNYERYICALFGDKNSLRDAAAFTLQFRDISAGIGHATSPVRLPSNVAKYLHEFDKQISDDQYASPHFRVKFLFTPLITSSKSQADEVVQFVPYDSELGKDINRVYLKEVERSKYLPSQIVKQMQSEGHVRFKMHHHTQLWKNLSAKSSGKGFGVQIAHTWYWYERWLDVVRDHCKQNSRRYRASP